MIKFLLPKIKSYKYWLTENRQFLKLILNGEDFGTFNFTLPICSLSFLGCDIITLCESNSKILAILINNKWAYSSCLTVRKVCEWKSSTSINAFDILSNRHSPPNFEF